MRRDWRETVRIATDLALLGLLTALAALPVVTAGAAVATAGSAIHHHLEYDRWPAPGFCWSVFRRRLLPGLAATAGCLVAAALVVADVLALRAGVVPGGVLLLVLTVVVACLAAGCAGLLVVADSARLAGQPGPSAAGRPAAVVSAAAVLVVAVVLGALVHPVLVPVLAGYTLFALHVIARRYCARTPAADPTPVEAAPVGAGR